MGLSESTVKGIAIAATLAAIAAAGAAVYYYVQATAAGDEPPIRVKGGSIEMDLIHSSKQWRKLNPTGANSRKEWSLSSGARAKDPYLVYLGPKKDFYAKCDKGLVHVGNVVKFVYKGVADADSATVTFQSNQKLTNVTSTADLDTPTSGKRNLRYDKAGFIKEIWVDSLQVCEFENKDQLDSVLITEEP